MALRKEQQNYRQLPQSPLKQQHHHQQSEQQPPLSTIQYSNDSMPTRAKSIMLRARQQRSQNNVQLASGGASGSENMANGNIDSHIDASNSSVLMPMQQPQSQSYRIKATHHQHHQFIHHRSSVHHLNGSASAPASASSSPMHQASVPTRIPITQLSPAPTSNFNQISKTATNLLNDIYEKHLLNQTTFDNVHHMNNGTDASNDIGNGTSSKMRTPTKMNGGATMVAQLPSSTPVTVTPLRGPRTNQTVSYDIFFSYSIGIGVVRMIHCRKYL